MGEMHERYLGKITWWDYSPKQDTCWYWRKMYKVKEEFKWGCRPSANWKWKGLKFDEYTVQAGYKWLIEAKEKPKCPKLTWSRASTPKHSFISWLVMRKRLPARERLAKITTVSAVCL